MRVWVKWDDEKSTLLIPKFSNYLFTKALTDYETLFLKWILNLSSFHVFDRASVQDDDHNMGMLLITECLQYFS